MENEKPIFSHPAHRRLPILKQPLQHRHISHADRSLTTQRSILKMTASEHSTARTVLYETTKTANIPDNVGKLIPEHISENLNYGFASKCGNNGMTIEIVPGHPTKLVPVTALQSSLPSSAVDATRFGPEMCIDGIIETPANYWDPNYSLCHTDAERAPFFVYNLFCT